MAAAATATARGDWSLLPPDLLGAIINRLPIPCCIRIRAVCRNWSLVAAEIPYRPINPQSPWLISTEEEEEGETVPHLYDFSERRSYHLIGISGIPRCVAFSHGWLVFKDQVSQLHLFNPITGVRIPLPPVTTFSDIISAVRDRRLDGRITGYIYQSGSKFMDHRTMLCYYLKIKAFSFSTETEDKNKNKTKVPTVFVLHGISLSSKRNRLSYASAGDETWTEIAPESRIFVGMADFAFHKEKLYGVFLDGRLVVVDNLTSPLEINFRYINSRWPDTLTDTYFWKHMFYLVDSADGKDLILVIRDYVLLDDRPPFKSSFLVLKLDLDSESGWIPLSRFQEETVIFLGEETSMALSTHGLPELKENCMYFTDIKTKLRTRDEGIYHMEDQTITPLFPDHDPSLLPLRNWFIPAL